MADRLGVVSVLDPDTGHITYVPNIAGQGTSILDHIYASSTLEPALVPIDMSPLMGPCHDDTPPRATDHGMVVASIQLACGTVAKSSLAPDAAPSSTTTADPSQARAARHASGLRGSRRGAR